jgi:hypothetical protein
MLRYRPIDVEKDRDALLEMHSQIIYSSGSPLERRTSLEDSREKWMSTPQPESYLKRLKETMKDVRNFAEFLEDEDGKLAGYLWVWFEDIEGYDTAIAYVMDLGVTEEFEEEVRSRGATLLRSDTGIENEASQKLHEKFGFERYHVDYEKNLVDED